MNILNTTILIIIVICILYLFSCYCNSQERFINVEQNLAWVIYNRRFGRRLEFAPPHSIASANLRAIENRENNNIIRTGGCVRFLKPSHINENGLSIVGEMELIYSLKHTCLSLPFKTPSQVNHLAINILDMKDWITFTYLILLNPLFMEFNKISAEQSTIAYYLRKPDRFTLTNKGMGEYNSQSQIAEVIKSSPIMDQCKNVVGYYDNIMTMINNNKTNIEIPLVAVHTSREQSKRASLNNHTLFTYKDYAQRQLNQLNMSNNENINIRAYYLDDITPSTQSLVRSLKYSQNLTGQYKVYDTRFNVMSDNDIINAYPYTYNIGSNLFREFCKYIYRCHINKTNYPIFTLNFDLSVNQNTITKETLLETKNQILEMCMLNSIGALTTKCVNGVNYSNGNFVRNANILSTAIRLQANNEFTLEFTTSRNNCVYINQNDILSVKLPIFENATAAKVYTTITPYKILVFITWFKPKEGMQWIVSEKNIAKGNDFESLFTKKNDIANIVINTAPKFIDHVHEVKLGYENYGKIFLEYLQNNAIH